MGTNCTHLFETFICSFAHFRKSANTHLSIYSKAQILIYSSFFSGQRLKPSPKTKAKIFAESQLNLIWVQVKSYLSHRLQPCPVIFNRLSNSFVRRLPFPFPALFLFKGRFIPFLKPHFKPRKITLGERVVLVQPDAVKNRFCLYQLFYIYRPFYNGRNPFPKSAPFNSGSANSSSFLPSSFSANTPSRFSGNSLTASPTGSPFTNCSNSFRAM